jgi:hypothetical protein
VVSQLIEDVVAQASRLVIARCGKVCRENVAEVHEHLPVVWVGCVEASTTHRLDLHLGLGNAPFNTSSSYVSLL